MNNVVKIIRTVGIMLFSVLFLISCSSKNVEELPFISLGSDDKTLITEYRIVASRASSGQLLSYAERLCEELGDKTGVSSKLSYDDEYFPVSDGTWIVYIGNVDVTIVKDHLRLMRSDDYTCRSFDRVTVIGGRNDSSTVIAIERFIEEILPVSNEYRPIPEGGGFDHFGSYDAERLSVGGTSISEFEISVTSVDDVEAVALAYELRNELSDTFGYWLDVRTGKRSETGRGIYIGTDKTCADGRGELSFSGNDIFLEAVDKAGLEKLTDVFLQLLKSDGDTGILEPIIPEHIYVPYGDARCDIASVSLKYSSALNSVSSYSILGNTADIYEPKVILLGEADSGELLSDTLYKYESDDTVFVTEDTHIEKISYVKSDALYYEVFSVKSGALEFVLVYISGETSKDISVNVSDITGATSLPVVAIAYTKSHTPVAMTHSEMPYFGEIFRDTVDLHGEACSYVCYADVSRLTVTVSAVNEKIGYTQMSVEIR